MFGYNNKTSSFYGAFTSCKSLTDVPSGLFANVNAREFGALFSGCTSLVSVGENLFAYNTNNIRTTYAQYNNRNGMFQGCTKLKNIPADIFSKWTVASLDNIFYGSGLTNIPEGLFDTLTDVLQRLKIVGFSTIQH